MKYKKSDLTKFAKDCAWGNTAFLNGLCMSEEIVHSELGHKITHEFVEDNNTLILEISKRFAKYTNDTMIPDIETGEVQDFCNIIKTIIDCCEENNWFENNKKDVFING